MLARTADALYWMSRYMERMDNLARLIEAALLMTSLSEAPDEWRSALIAAGCEEGFDKQYDQATAEAACAYLSCAPDNPSSIINCIDKARANARAMRTALTRDMWDAVNESWLLSRTFTEAAFDPQHLPDTLDWVRQAAARFAGACITTMLRTESFWFVRLGAQIERADNTARILDVKYHVLLPEHSGVGSMLDYYQWTSLLRANSATRAYQAVYREEVKPWNVAELLILRPEMPRSLRSCYDEIVDCLDQIARIHGGRRGECHRIAGAMAAELRYGRIEDIFRAGLHERLTDFIDRSAVLGDQIGAFYMR
jgi:uncharacterized alpha-E superfamily protein